MFLTLFFLRYNQIDKHLQDQTIQCLINGEFKGGFLLHYEEALMEIKKCIQEEKGNFDPCFIFCEAMVFAYVIGNVPHSNAFKAMVHG